MVSAIQGTWSLILNSWIMRAPGVTIGEPKGSVKSTASSGGGSDTISQSETVNISSNWASSFISINPSRCSGIVTRFSEPLKFSSGTCRRVRRDGRAKLLWCSHPFACRLTWGSHCAGLLAVPCRTPLPANFAKFAESSTGWRGRMPQ